MGFRREKDYVLQKIFMLITLNLCRISKCATLYPCAVLFHNTESRNGPIILH